MDVYRLKITPWCGADCHRTVELSGEHSLERLHEVIRREFELDDDHLWAFFLSGEFFDRATEFGTASEAGAPSVKLGGLDLEPGMRFGYVFDFGDEHRFDVEVEAVTPAGAAPFAPRVVDRVGTPVKQYPDEGELADDSPVADVSPAQFPDDLVADLESVLALVDVRERDREGLNAMERERVLTVVERALELCPTYVRLLDLSDGFDLRHEDIVGELIEEGRVGDDERARALERRYVQLPRSHGHDHGFGESLVADVRWLQLRYRDFDDGPVARLAKVPTDELNRIAGEVLRECTSADRFAELCCASQAATLESILQDRVRVLAGARSDEELLSLLDSTDRALGTKEPSIAAANQLSAKGERRRALGLLDRIPQQKCPPRELLKLGVAFAAAGSPERAERIYLALMSRRWLSGVVRPKVVEALSALLTAAGRQADAKRLLQQEQAREVDRRKARGGTVTREGPKLGRNDPCACGSGKKAKKCCGTEARR